jgi:hypothetical protein
VEEGNTTPAENLNNGEAETPDWLAEKIGFELAVAFLQHTLQACSDWKSRIMAAKSAKCGLIAERKKTNRRAEWRRRCNRAEWPFECSFG